MTLRGRVIETAQRKPGTRGQDVRVVRLGGCQRPLEHKVAFEPVKPGGPRVVVRLEGDPLGGNHHSRDRLDGVRMALRKLGEPVESLGIALGRSGMQAAERAEIGRHGPLGERRPDGFRQGREFQSDPVCHARHDVVAHIPGRARRTGEPPGPDLATAGGLGNPNVEHPPLTLAPYPPAQDVTGAAGRLASGFDEAAALPREDVNP